MRLRYEMRDVVDGLSHAVALDEDGEPARVLCGRVRQDSIGPRSRVPATKLAPCQVCVARLIIECSVELAKLGGL